MEPKTIQTPDGPRTIVDEMCHCGHLRSDHNDRYSSGHGPCKTCSCRQFTWKEFIFKED